MLALYDRFLLRQEVMPLREEEDFKKLMKINKPYEPSPDSLLTIDELERDYKDIQEVNLPDGIIDVLFLIKKEILLRQVHASDRRFRDLVSILKASAFFRGDSEIEKEDIYNIKSSLWTYSSDIKSVDILVNKVLQAI
jgi:MoxR-like ATPase